MELLSIGKEPELLISSYGSPGEILHVQEEYIVVHPSDVKAINKQLEKSRAVFNSKLYKALR